MSEHRCTGAIGAAGLSRRALLNQFGLGLGGIALADLVNPLRMSGGVADSQSRPGALGTDLHFAPQGQARDLPVHVRRSVADRDLRLQAAAATAQRRAAARLGARASGSPACRATSPRCRWPARPSRSRGTAQAAPGSATCCRTRRAIVDDLCFVRSMHTEAINHDPAITFFQTGSQIAGRPSIGAWLRYGLGSDNANLPAFVVLRHARARSASRSTRGCGAAGSCRRSTRACSSARGRDPVLYLTNPRRHRRRDSRRRMLDRLRRAATSTQLERDRRPGDRDAHRPVRDGLPHADLACRSVTDVSTSPRSTFDALRRRTRASPAPSPPTACWPAGWPSAACGSSSSIHQGWDQHGRPADGHPRASARRPTRPRAALVTRPQAARPARRHARRLGRRVRPHDLLPGQAHRRRTTAATTTRAASRSGWPAAA